MAAKKRGTNLRKGKQIQGSKLQRTQSLRLARAQTLRLARAQTLRSALKRASVVD